MSQLDLGEAHLYGEEPATPLEDACAKALDAVWGSISTVEAYWAARIVLNAAREHQASE